MIFRLKAVATGDEDVCGRAVAAASGIRAG